VTFTTRPGTIRVRVSAEDAAGHSLDIEDREVHVPDFTSAGPILTVPEIYRARTAREFVQIRESAAALPTASHQFARTDQLLVRFRAYGPGGTAPTVAVNLRNSQGEVISTLPAPDRPGGRKCRSCPPVCCRQLHHGN
jgi:hypothetical protein